MFGIGFARCSLAYVSGWCGTSLTLRLVWSLPSPRARAQKEEQ
jgi:hypothetical protein